MSGHLRNPRRSQTALRKHQIMIYEQDTLDPIKITIEIRTRCPESCIMGREVGDLVMDRDTLGSAAEDRVQGAVRGAPSRRPAGAMLS